jgi:hypothetical protein
VAEAIIVVVIEDEAVEVEEGGVEGEVLERLRL